MESVNHAVAAERGGAHRIELCTDLASGGITPSEELMQTARRLVQIPIHVLIRPRAGNFCYSSDELEIMAKNIRTAKQFGMDGVVLGVLCENDRVDIERTKALVELAQPLSVTFHRAFDASNDLDTSLEDVIQAGASRILTSAGQPRAIDALATLARLVQSAGDRISIMPCGGINPDNVVRIVRATSAQEVHSSAGTSNPHSTGNSGDLSEGNNDIESGLQSERFEQKVARLVTLLSDVWRDEHVR